MPSFSWTAVVQYLPLPFPDIIDFALFLKPYFPLSFKAPALSLARYSSYVWVWSHTAADSFCYITISSIPHQPALPLPLSKHLSHKSSRHNTTQCNWLKIWPTSLPLAGLMTQGISWLCKQLCRCFEWPYILFRISDTVYALQNQQKYFSIFHSTKQATNPLLLKKQDDKPFWALKTFLHIEIPYFQSGFILGPGLISVNASSKTGRPFEK